MRKFLLMLITLMVAVPLMNASSGSCGKNVKWNLSRDGVLVISGKGDMKNFGECSGLNAPGIRSLLMWFMV